MHPVSDWHALQFCAWNRSLLPPVLDSPVVNVCLRRFRGRGIYTLRVCCLILFISSANPPFESKEGGFSVVMVLGVMTRMRYRGGRGGDGDERREKTTERSDVLEMSLHAQVARRARFLLRKLFPGCCFFMRPISDCENLVVERKTTVR